MVKFPQNTALPDEDQTDIAVSGAGPGVFLLSLRDVVQVVSRQRAAAASGHVGHSYHFP